LHSALLSSPKHDYMDLSLSLSLSLLIKISDGQIAAAFKIINYFAGQLQLPVDCSRAFIRVIESLERYFSTRVSFICGEAACLTRHKSPVSVIEIFPASQAAFSH